MKALIVSDSHGRHTYLEKALKKVGKIDLFIHLGDIEGGEEYIDSLISCEKAMVSGNNDYFTSLERDKVLDIGKYKAFLTHGHRYRVNFGTDDIKEHGILNEYDIVMFGHTHKPVVLQEDGVYIINPGSISQPRQEGGRPSFVLMELDSYGEIHFTVNYL